MEGQQTEKLNKPDAENKPIGRTGHGYEKKKKESVLCSNLMQHGIGGAEGIWQGKDAKQTGQKEGRGASHADRLAKSRKTPEKKDVKTRGETSESSSQVEV